MPRGEDYRKLRRGLKRAATRQGQRMVRDVLRYASGKTGRGRLLNDSGYHVVPKPPQEAEPTAPPIIRREGQPEPGRPRRQSDPPDGPTPGPTPPSSPPPRGTVGNMPQPDVSKLLQQDDDWPQEHTLDTRKNKAVLDPGAGIWSTEVQTPESSNVYAFAYDEDEGILYVTYKANGKANKDGKRPHVRGAMYSYGGRMRKVPKHVYVEMRAAASKGKFVWDYLRVRGTIWGHHYPYTLVSPSMAGNVLYVPRKATKRGLRTRSAVTASPIQHFNGRKPRRPFDRSTLPERLRR